NQKHLPLEAWWQWERAPWQEGVL
ncbi:MAG: hypothetical protein JWO08_4429, partial [Verrucomicrobiaceae bacterium]|nr:hypothetical protein [Verrucomicrobiaceae bacterium]